MKPCICEECANLKSELGAEEGVVMYSCEFGFPSDSCEACESGECDYDCAKYIEITLPEECEVHCSKCGKTMAVSQNGESGSVYCIDCYLSDRG